VWALYATENVIIPMTETEAVDTGVSVGLPPGSFGVLQAVHNPMIGIEIVPSPPILPCKFPRRLVVYMRNSTCVSNYSVSVGECIAYLAIFRSSYATPEPGGKELFTVGPNGFQPRIHHHTQTMAAMKSHACEAVDSDDGKGDQFSPSHEFAWTVFASKSVELKPGQRAEIPTDLSCNVPRGCIAFIAPIQTPLSMVEMIPSPPLLPGLEATPVTPVLANHLDNDPVRVDTGQPVAVLIMFRSPIVADVPYCHCTRREGCGSHTSSEPHDDEVDADDMVIVHK